MNESSLTPEELELLGGSNTRQSDVFPFPNCQAVKEESNHAIY